ncbi:MAG TPA: M28 family peptidase [Gemmatimonadales bacterium]|nr:M28 family peptidase [Gemmatimonadales bacterium]
MRNQLDSEKPMRHWMVTAIILSACGGAAQQDAAVPGPQPSQQLAGSCPEPARIDSVAMITDLFRLADDSMAGRLIGSPQLIEARDYLASRFEALGIAAPAGGRLQRIEVASERLPGVSEAWNVLGVVRGTATPERWIVVTAHYDHVGIGRPVGGDSIYNGSDDNASGAAALAVVAEYFREHPIGRSILFAAVDGEERGMWGSRGLVENPPVPLESIDANINLDMVSRNDRNELYVAGTSHYPQFTEAVESAARCSRITLLAGHDTDAAGARENWTGQSDHIQFHRKGIPFLYFGVEDHPDYHRPGDHPDRAMKGFYVEAVRAVIGVIERLP